MHIVSFVAMIYTLLLYRKVFIVVTCHAIIPARYASQRLEGKPLALIHGLPMFWHVYTRAAQAKSVVSVTLATDDARIAKAAKDLNVPCLMTRADHASGTDRVFEAACLLGLGEQDIVVNIQGDEPLLEPAMLDELLAPFTDPLVQVSTLCMSITPEEAASPHRVKLVSDIQGNALYFSRSLIPYIRDPDAGGADGADGEGREEGADGADAKGRETRMYTGHIGLYAFQMQALARFVTLPQGQLEQLEKLEQLRFLEHGIPIRVVPTNYTCFGVDTEQDLEHVRSIFAEKML